MKDEKKIFFFKKKTLNPSKVPYSHFDQEKKKS